MRFEDALAAMISAADRNNEGAAAVEQLTFGRSVHAIPDLPEPMLSAHMTPATAGLVQQIPEIARAVLRSRYPEIPEINGFQEAARYLQCRFWGLTYEHCHLLMFSRGRKLIADVLIQKGSISSVPFYPRNNIDNVLGRRCDAIVIGHNHPGGTAAPSQADLESTRSLLLALDPLGIPLLDHIILAENNAVSIRETGYIPEQVWRDQPNNCPVLMKQWHTSIT